MGKQAAKALNFIHQTFLEVRLRRPAMLAPGAKIFSIEREGFSQRSGCTGPLCSHPALKCIQLYLDGSLRWTSIFFHFFILDHFFYRGVDMGKQVAKALNFIHQTFL